LGDGLIGSVDELGNGASLVVPVVDGIEGVVLPGEPAEMDDAVVGGLAPITTGEKESVGKGEEVASPGDLLVSRPFKYQSAFSPYVRT